MDLAKLSDQDRLKWPRISTLRTNDGAISKLHLCYSGDLRKVRIVSCDLSELQFDQPFTKQVKKNYC